MRKPSGFGGRSTVRFPLGRLMITPGAQETIPNHEVLAALRRHAVGDWGDVDEHDWKENDYSVGRRLRLLSAYRSSSGVKFWIITEADRSATTVLLPEEY